MRKRTSKHSFSLALAGAVLLGTASLAIAQNPCEVTDAGGTVTLPPAGCEYLSPDEVHMIIDGLPPGTTIELAPIHKSFICDQGPAGLPGCPPPGICEDAGGPLGGNVDCFSSTLELDVHGTGDLTGFNRTLSVPILCQVASAPRTVGDDVQSFDTDMVILTGSLFGDPDFDSLQVTGGTDQGLPSPGHTTLTRLPSGNWNVDSFFDIEYRIDFVGAPGSVLEGMSGSTTSTIRMSTGEAYTVVPTVTPWAVTALVLLLLGTGVFVLRRRRSLGAVA